MNWYLVFGFAVFGVECWLRLAAWRGWITSHPEELLPLWTDRLALALLHVVVILLGVGGVALGLSIADFPVEYLE